MMKEETPDMNRTPEEKRREKEMLQRIKKSREGKEYVRLPIMNGYVEIEKSKYERLEAEGRLPDLSKHASTAIIKH